MNVAYGGMKVTIYIRSEDSLMGSVHRREVRLWMAGTREYAQYQAAPFIVYTVKGKRTKRMFVASSHPYILVLKGWNKWPAVPDDVWVNKGGSIEMKYSSHDDRFITDFEAALGKVDIVDIVADFRGANPNERKFT